MNAELAIWIGHLGETATRCDKYRRQVMMSNQASVNPSTEQTPNMMVFEREATLPIQAVIKSPTEKFCFLLGCPYQLGEEISKSSYQGLPS